MLALFAATLFSSAALLFFVEPLVAKGLLPVLGGGTAVWTSALAFFQLALCAGYVYAHVAPARLGIRRHALVHVAALGAVALLLPLHDPMGWSPPARFPALWLFGRLALSVGPAFLLLAATAPLAQRWLAGSSHPDAQDPYFLYAASNAGSLAALLAYPLLVEPVLGLSRQRQLFGAGAIATAALLAACAAATLRRARAGAGRPATSAGAPPRNAGARARERARWVMLAAVPASLLVSVTSYVTTDLAALPLLWVLPLAIYLATFVIAFARRQVISPGLARRLQPFFLLPIAVELFLKPAGGGGPLIPLHAIGFLATALVCHQELARRRPDAARSTDFYLCVAAGGALGGLFNVLVAPSVFDTLIEYPLGLCAAALLRPVASPAIAGRRARLGDSLLPAALAALLIAGVVLIGRQAPDEVAAVVATGLLLCGAGALTYGARDRPLRFGLCLAAIVAAGRVPTPAGPRVLHRARSFYGVHTVTLRPPSLRLLANGNTIHGAQDTGPARRHQPLSYYHRQGPAGALMAALDGRPQRRRVGVVGLGAGALAAYAAPGEQWTFFELDPAVVAIARDPALFTYLADAAAPIEVRLGDARLALHALPDRALGLLVLDAFSSDAIPAHLLTREALALYARKIEPGGLIAFHVSNRYLDLEPVIAAGAASLGLVARVRGDRVDEAQARAGLSASRWMVVGRAPADLAVLGPGWLPARASSTPWTDDAWSLWGALHIRLSELFAAGPLAWP